MIVMVSTTRLRSTSLTFGFGKRSVVPVTPLLVRSRVLLWPLGVLELVMTNAAVVILAGTESHADVGRLVNGLETATEFAETDGDDVELIFDGAGTQWVPKLEDEESEYHELYRAVRDHTAVCDFCAGAFGVEDAVDDAGVVMLDENDGHPSVRSLVDDGYEVITF